MTNPIAAAERIVAHLARCVISDELRADAAVLLEMVRSRAPGDLEAMDRALRGAVRDAAIAVVDGELGYTMEFAASPMQHREHYDIAEDTIWRVVARYVQQLQRAAWIAGRDAAADYLTFNAVSMVRDARGELGGMFAEQSATDIAAAAERVRALEPPAQETGR